MNKFLKAKIVEKYGNQFQFARMLNWHEASISKVIRGKRQLKREEQAIWARILDMDLEEFQQVLIGNFRKP